MNECKRCAAKGFEECQCEPVQSDMINHPQHYNSSGAYCACGRQIECIDVVRNMSFQAGNAIKYLWRYKHKNGVEDLNKAIWYIEDLIKNL